MRDPGLCKEGGREGGTPGGPTAFMPAFWRTCSSPHSQGAAWKKAACSCSALLTPPPPSVSSSSHLSFCELHRLPGWDLRIPPLQLPSCPLPYASCTYLYDTDKRRQGWHLFHAKASPPSCRWGWQQGTGEKDAWILILEPSPRHLLCVFQPSLWMSLPSFCHTPTVLHDFGWFVQISIKLQENYSVNALLEY